MKEYQMVNVPIKQAEKAGSNKDAARKVQLRTAIKRSMVKQTPQVTRAIAKTARKVLETL